MGALTVRDVLTLAPLAGTFVLAGAAGLDRPVTGVNVMEVPDIESYVRSGELLLTTAYPVRDRPERLVELLPELHALGLAGLAIKPLRYLDHLPDRLVAEADRLGFPILVAPNEMSFNDVIGAVLAVVLADYGADPAGAEAIRERLTGVALAGGGLEEIARTLAGALERPVTIVDDDAVVLSGADGSGGAGGDRPPTGRTWDFPVTVAGAARGRVVVGGTGEPTLGQRRLIRQSCFAAGMLIAQALASLELDRRLRVLFLEELVTGPRLPEAGLQQRARLFGWTLEGEQAVLVARCSAEVGDAAASAATRATLGRSALVWCRGHEVIAIRAGSRRAPDRTDEADAAWRTALVAAGGGQVTVVTGPPVLRLSELAASHAEAQESIAIAQAMGRDLARHGDLELERILLAAPRHQVRAFVERQLGPLLVPSGAGDGDLARTLAAYLGHGNAAEAARTLYVHYNTMKHRLARITELLGVDLHDPRTRLSLALALEMRALVVLDGIDTISRRAAARPEQFLTDDDLDDDNGLPR